MGGGGGLKGESDKTRAGATAKDFAVSIAPACEAVGPGGAVKVTPHPYGCGVGVGEADEVAGLGLVDGGFLHGGGMG